MNLLHEMYHLELRPKDKCYQAQSSSQVFQRFNEIEMLSSIRCVESCRLIVFTLEYK